MTVLTALLGPIISVEATKVLGPTYSEYEGEFVTEASQHWQADGSNWAAANYYDRAYIFYQQWARTGDATYLERANAIAVDYRDNYILADNGVTTWWSMPKGVAAHYLVTGDVKSLDVVGKIATWLASPWHIEDNWTNLVDTTYSEGREIARVLEALTTAITVGAQPRAIPNIQANGDDWGYPAVDFHSAAASLVEKILTSDFQKGDGSRPRIASGDGTSFAVDKPFMNGLINEALINYYEQVSRDARIVEFIKKNLDYMWANEWDEATKSFQYIDFGVDMEGQTDASSPDGNGLIVTGFGFIYKVTGDALYKERGDLVFDGLVGTATEGAWLEGSKQFNQAYNSLNYLGYAYGDGELPLPSALQIILGTAGADTLYGTTADEIIEGLANNDTLEGRGGSDTLDGGSGNDLLNGGLGSDVLIGGLGSDTYIVDNASDVVVEEGLGTDTVIVGTSYVLSSGVSVEVIRTSNAAAKTALNLTGNSFGQTFCGTAGANVLNSGLNAAGHRDLLYGYNGNDTYFVDGADVVYEGARGGADRVFANTTYALQSSAEVETLATVNAALTTSINLTGNGFGQTIIGNNGANALFGLAGADRMLGGAGNDRLVGGLGRDTMTGGAGRDVFDFNAVCEVGKGPTRDVITDFLHLNDIIDLSTLDANGAAAGHAFSFLEAEGAGFTGVAGQLHWFRDNLSGTVSDRTIVEGDTNGDKIADFQIQLIGLKALTAADFIL